MRTILIYGIANRWGIELARRLSTRHDLRLLGIDRRPPAEPVGRTEVVALPESGERLAELMQREGVAAVVRVDLCGELRATDSEVAKQANVIGMLELLGACLHTQVEQVIIRSSTLVYGPIIANPAFVPESWPLARKLRSIWLRDSVEIEMIAADFQKRHQRPQITLLRFPAVLGGGVQTAPATYLTLPRRANGFDPRVQVLHGTDALAAIEHAIDHRVPGAVNIAADPPLPLSRALRLATPPDRSPLQLLSQAITQVRTGTTLPFDPDYLRYSCVADTSRMRGEFGFTPAYSAEAALTALYSPIQNPAEVIVDRSEVVVHGEHANTER